MAQLTRLRLEGFRSIPYTELELNSLNVLIGINGSGKSNLCKFFTLLNFMMTGSLQLYIQEYLGGGDALLHHGAKKTPFLRAALSFRTDKGTNKYEATLVHAAGDTLVFTEERASFMRADGGGVPQERVLGGGPSAAQGPQQNLTSRIATVRGCAQSRCHASDPRRSRL